MDRKAMIAEIAGDVLEALHDGVITAPQTLYEGGSYTDEAQDRFNALHDLVERRVDENTPQLSLRELTQALAAGKDVRWRTDDYSVKWSDLPSGPALVINHVNGFGGAMEISEIEGCYIKGEK